MSVDAISPKYQMRLVKQISDAIWSEYNTYKDVRAYIEKWHESRDDWNDYWENFKIYYKDKGEVDLLSTLHGINAHTLLKIAVDMGVDTPDFIPSIATFKNDLKAEYQTANITFEKAFKQIEVILILRLA